MNTQYVVSSRVCQKSLTTDGSSHNSSCMKIICLFLFFFPCLVAKNGKVKGEIHSLGSVNFGFPAPEIRLYVYIVLNRNLTSILFCVLPKQLWSQRHSNNFIRHKREFCWKIYFHCQRSDEFSQGYFKIRVLLLYC